MMFCEATIGRYPAPVSISNKTQQPQWNDKLIKPNVEFEEVYGLILQPDAAFEQVSAVSMRGKQGSGQVPGSPPPAKTYE